MGSEILKNLFFQMLRIRLVEEKVAEVYPEQEMRCPVHLCIGQEATAVGVCANLSRKDYALSTHRSHGHYLAKGGDLKAMISELYGKVTGCSRGKGGSMHLIDLSTGLLAATPIVGSTIPIAVGAVYGSLMRGDQRVGVAFFGDAAVEEGVFHESINFAILRKLPVIFVCENNQYSVYSPLRVRQPEGRAIVDLAKGHGVEGFQGDGNNVLEVYQMAAQAIQKARHGGGPTFLEFKTYRWREHCGPNYDNYLGYRTDDEFQEWKQRDPVETFKAKLLKESILQQKDVDSMTSELQREIEDAFAFAKASPFPEPDLLLNHVYAD